MDRHANELFGEIDAWVRSRRTRAGGRTERLIVAWLRKRMPDLRATYADFRTFLVAESARNPTWGFMQFVARWLMSRTPMVIRDAFAIQMVIVMKTIENHEREARPAAMALVKRIRALQKETVAVRKEIDRLQNPVEGQRFWAGFGDRFTTTIGEVLGADAARTMSEDWGRELRRESASPLQLALGSVRERWDILFGQTTALTDETLSAIQACFISETVVSAAHAPSKRGVRRRIVELARAGLSHSEIAAFEGMKPKAVAEHLRRARGAVGTSTKVI